LDGSGFDDSFLKAALDAIPVDGKTVVLKSTILPGTTDAFQNISAASHPVQPRVFTEATVDEICSIRSGRLSDIPNKVGRMRKSDGNLAARAIPTHRGREDRGAREIFR
jgi:hypothetical protein